MENRDSDELNALTSQVVDYYKRYSQNPNFSSYLRGDVPAANENLDTCVEPLEVNVSVSYGERRPPLIGCDNNENDINVINVPDDQICNPSPTSSITSTRKLEWDNLADIGYGNCQKQKHLHKSLSLPVLTALEKIKLGDHKLRLSPEGNVADNATQTQRIAKSSSPESLSTSSYKKVSSISTNSTSSFKDSPQVIDTTSSFSSFSKAKTATTETDFTDIESTAINSDRSKVFQSCIGLPMAESTPYSVNIYGNNNNSIPNKQDNSNKEEESTQSDSQKKTVITTLNLPGNKDNETVKYEGTPPEIDEVQELKCVAKCVRSNIKHLSLTKPLSVECTNYKEISDKVIQTSASKIVKTTSVSVQTEQYIQASEEHIEENQIYPVYEEKRIVEYVVHGNSPEEPSLRSLGTNTESDMVVSQCNSFEYIFEGNVKSSSTKSPTSTSSNPSRDKYTSSENKLRRVQGKSNLALPTSENEQTLSSNVTDFSSKSSPLAELITTKLSKHMMGDVEKSINMLQKLLKSKRYDKVTKQYYVKKIVQKIMHYDYSSETSVNSEFPSQSSDDNQDRSEKDGVKIMVESSEEPITEQPVQDRRLPTPLENKIPNLKLEIKTFSTEILPEQVAQETHTKTKVEYQQPSKLKDARFTITNNHKDCQNSDEISQIGDTNPDNTPSPRSSPQSAVETSNSSNKSKSFRNWKDELTLSEKRLERRNTTLHCGDGSSNESELLLSFAKKERENQISWINNEISHLNKLKDLLQKKSGESRVNIEKLTEPQVEEMIEKNKTTSVYVITTERSGRSSNTSDTNSISVKSAPERSLNKKCKCLSRRGEKQWCDSSNCPYLKYRSGRMLNKQSFDRMLKKDLEMLPHLTSSKDSQCDNDIENAKLIASEIYKGKTSDCYVRRYVFEMPIRDDSITEEGYRKILYQNCNINVDMQNAKLIGSEIVKGVLPNTNIRRYVFEVPIFADDSSNVICTTPRKTSYSSRESTLLSRAKKCMCKNLPVGQTCKCADVKVCECEKKKDTKYKSHIIEQHEITINPTGTGDSVSDIILDNHRGSKPKTYESNAFNGKMQPVSDPVITKKSSRKVSVSEDTKGVQIVTDKIETTLTDTNRRYKDDNIQHPSNQVGHDGITGGNIPLSPNRHERDPQSPGSQSHTLQSPGSQRDSPQSDVTHGYNPQSHDAYSYNAPSQNIKVSDPQSHGSRGYDPQSNGVNGYDRESHGVHNYDPQSQGTHGYDHQSQGSQSYRPQSHGAHGYDSQTQGIQGYNSQAHGSQGYRPQSHGNRRDMPQSDGTYGTEPQSQGIQGYDSQSHDNQSYRPQSPVNHRDRPQLRSTHDNDPQSQVIQGYDPQSHDNQSYRPQSPVNHRDRPQLRSTHGNDPQSQVIQGYDSQSHGKQSYGPQSPGSHRDTPQLHGTHVSDPQSQVIQGYDSQSHVDQSYRPQSPGNHRDRPQLRSTHGNDPQSQVIQGYDSQSHGGQSYRLQSSDHHRDGSQLHETNGYDSQSRSNQIYRPQSPSHGYRPSVGEMIISEYQKAEILNVSPKIIDLGTDTANTNGSRPETGDFQQTVAAHPVVYIPDSNDLRKRSLEQQYIFKRTPQTEITKITYHTANKMYDEIINYEGEPSANTVAPAKMNKQSQYENPEGSDAITSGTEKSPTKNKTTKHKTKQKASESSSSSYSSSSSGSFDSDSGREVPLLCLCCNKAEAKYRSVLRGLPEKLRDALCEPCYTNNQQQTNWPHTKQHYMHPGHVCSCYTVLKTETIKNIQRTVNELENLERKREICSCTRECRVRKHGGKSGKQRKSIAYMLTFEDVEKTDSEEDDKGKKHRLKPLEEVRVKVPHLVKKSHKDKENRKKHKRDKHGKQRRKHHSSKPLTLQDYLCVHRPNFVANAEERRKVLIELGYLREERCQKYKQLLAMSNGIFPETNVDNKASRLRMFTSQEMKQITAKNYKKLPEVQSKLEENRNKQIKKANKILADIFNKKLRDNVLKGRLTLSTNTSVIKLP